MAINFTDSPADGATQVIGGRTYTYNSAKNKWDTTATEVLRPTAATYATVNDLPETATTGDQAFVSGTNRLYIWNGSGWYNIALINTNPTISGVSSSYDLATDGTATVITITATDPEGLPITYSIASDTSGSIATVTQGTGASSNVFTITPSTSQADAGSFSLTFRASDGVNLATAPATFTLQFTVENSNYTTVLLSPVGGAGQTNNSFVDSSTNNHTITVANQVVQGSFSPYRHGGYSTYFDGSSSLSVTNTGSTLAFGTGDVTVEGWINQSLAVGTQYAILADLNVSGVGPVAFWYNGTVGTGAEFRLGAADVTQMIGFRADTPINEWFHFAYVRESGTWKFYLNGTEITTRNTDVGDADGYSFANFNPNVGSFTNGLNMAGYMTDLRVVVGTAVYTSNFTPPTERLTAITNTSLLTCHLPYIADGSTNSHAITVNGNTKTVPFAPYDYQEYSASSHGGSMFFDGAGDYLTIADDASIDLSTGDFTLEAWIYLGNTSGNQLIVDRYTSGNNGSYQFYFRNTGTSIAFWTVADGVVAQDPNASRIRANIWHHVVATRESGTVKLYVDGTEVATGSCTTNFDSSLTLAVGGQLSTGTNYVSGALSDVRIVKGTAVYTSAFTPPTAPLTAISGTSLLLSATNPAVVDKSQSCWPVRFYNGSNTSTTITKYLNSSMYFDGVNDTVSFNNNESLGSYAGDFTIEMWVYPTTVGNANLSYLYFQGQTAANYAPILLGQGIGNYNFVYYATTTGTSWNIASGVSIGAGAQNTWSHIAVVREGTNLKTYIDGTLGTTTSIGTAALAATTSAYTWLGSGNYQNTYFGGYISDFRLTKGLARYTANFTPPTAALQG